MSGQKTISTSETRLEALQLQSSAYGATIPIVGGVTRIAGNLIYYNDFKAVPSTTTQGGKGGGTKTQTTTYTYQASILMALCYGQIAGVPRIWKGKQLYSDNTGAAAVLSNATQTYALPYAGGSVTVANAATFGANLGVTYSYIYENGEPPATGSLTEGIDYIQAAGVYTFFAATLAGGYSVAIKYSYTSIPASNPALSQLGCTLLPGHTTQSPPSWIATLHPSDSLAYAGMAAVSAQGYSLGTGAQVDNHTFEVVGPGAYSINATTPDIDPAAFVVRVLKDARYGARMPAQFVDDYAGWTSYCLANNIIISPAITTQVSAAEFLKMAASITNTGLVWSAGRLKFIPFGDTSAAANGAAFVPNTTPVYALTDDAFVTSGNEPPVKVTRKPSSKAYNHFRIQFRNRANNYAVEISEAKDQADIDVNGLRSAEIVRADWICDGVVARSVAQIMLQRSLYVRASFEFNLPWNYGMLEPMDLVTITDASQGLNQYAVRITKVEETDGNLTFTAEDFALGVASAASYSTQIGAGFIHDYNAAPGAVNAPTMFEAPVSLTTTGLEVYIAASGNNAAWGGARVWVSLDGTNYKQIGILNGPSRNGTLTSAVGSNVGLTGLKSALTSGSAADSSAYATLCYVGGTTPEYLAFESAALTGAGAYTLGGLTRSAYQTQASAHAVGDPFVRVDTNIAKSGSLNLNMIGKTIYVKLTSFNIYGGGDESLASVVAYPYAITGYMAKLPPAPPATFYGVSEPFGIRLQAARSVDPDVVSYQYRAGATWDAATIIEPAGGTSYLWQVQAVGAFTLWVAAVDVFGNVSAPVSATVTVTGGAISALTSAINGRDMALSWTGVPGSFSISGYEVRYGATWASATVLDFRKTTSYIEPVRWGGSRLYWIAVVDVYGNYGTPVSLNVTISLPSSVTASRSEVIDNNALLYWTASTVVINQLPIDRYEVRKGASYAAGTVVGSNGNSTFAAVFEQSSGAYIYWVAPVDTAGNVGAAIGIPATINQPPDFVLRNNYNSALGGTFTNFYNEAGRFLGPVDITQQFGGHFTSRAWATPNDQIAAGYPIYIEPSLASGSYEEIIDYGTAIPATVVTSTLASTVVAGSVAVVCTISWKLNVGDAWTVITPGMTTALIPAFRYVRIHYDFNCTAGANLLQISGLNVKLAIKQRNDSGSGTAATGGTPVSFGYAFVAADTPIIQPNGATPLIPVVIYVGGTNPTGFTVRLYNLSGTDVGGAFSWTVRGY